METIVYTGAVLSGFMLSQTYNYFFGRTSTNPNDNVVHANTNIHIHTYSNPKSNTSNSNSNTNMLSTETEMKTIANYSKLPNDDNSSDILPKSLLYDIELFENNSLKPLKIKSLSNMDTDNNSTSLESELRKKLGIIRNKVSDDMEK